MLTVTRKGGRRATVVLPPATAAALDAYLTDRAHHSPDHPLDGPLLATAAGGRLDQSALCKLVRRLARAAAIPSWQELTPHSLRHTAITLALDAGAALRDVQDFAGHRDPAPRGATTTPVTPSTATPPTPSPPTSPAAEPVGRGQPQQSLNPPADLDPLRPAGRRPSN